MATVWDMSGGRFWEPVECDGLFLLFDCDAHVTNGVPDIDVNVIRVHVIGCEECQEAFVYVTGNGVTDSPAVLHYDW